MPLSRLKPFSRARSTSLSCVSATQQPVPYGFAGPRSGPRVRESEATEGALTGDREKC